MGRTPEEILALATIDPELDQVSTCFTLRLPTIDSSRS